MDWPVEEFFLYLREEKNYSPNTARAYRGDVLQFVCFLEKEGVTTPKRRHIRRFLAELGRRCKKATLGRKISALRTFYRYLLKRCGVEENPFEAVQGPKREKKVPHWLSPEEVRKLLESPDTSHLLGVRDRAILEVLYSCGLRASELVSLKVTDLSLEQGILRVLGKGRKERLVPLGTVAKEWLEKYLDLRPKKGDALFLSRLGTPLSTRTLQRIVRKYGEMAGISPPPTPHTLRHTCASHLLERGLALREVQEFLGHESIAATQVYTHLENQAIKALYKSFHPRS